MAKQYLSYFQGPAHDWTAPDQTELRTAVPENRQRVYDVRAVVARRSPTTGSVLELRAGFGAGMVTALARLEGSPLGILANDPAHLGGAIDRDAADKAARFLQLCDAHGLPVLLALRHAGVHGRARGGERTAQVRHFSRMFVTAAAMTVPVRHRRAAQGLRPGRPGDGGRQLPGRPVHALLADGRVRRDGPGGRGAARLPPRARGDRRPGRARRRRSTRWSRRPTERGKALNMAAHLEIDDVIDPAETRSRVLAMFRAAPARTTGAHALHRPLVNCWATGRCRGGRPAAGPAMPDRLLDSPGRRAHRD